MKYKIIRAESPGSCGSMDDAVERLERAVNCELDNVGAELHGSIHGHTQISPVNHVHHTHYLFQCVVYR